MWMPNSVGLAIWLASHVAGWLLAIWLLIADNTAGYLGCLYGWLPMWLAI